MEHDIFSDDLDAYLRWKDEAAKKGSTPMDVAAKYEQMGMKSYARKLKEFIEKMEAAL